MTTPQTGTQATGTQQRGTEGDHPADPLFPLSRPGPLARAARHGARLYERARDLPGALPGLAGAQGRVILTGLARAEARCEQERRTRAPGYRPGLHVQVLAALLAEAADQPNASGSALLRRAM